jgi:hypothetical protein
VLDHLKPDPGTVPVADDDAPSARSLFGAAEHAHLDPDNPRDRHDLAVADAAGVGKDNGPRDG